LASLTGCNPVAITALQVQLLPSTLMSPREEIDYWVSKFRTLVGWNISYDPDAEYKGQCAVSDKDKSATIYGWSDSVPLEPDYFLHEILHIAYRASKMLGREGEELFIQDLCAIWVGGRAANGSRL
jgi:hypothetical protein